MEGMQGMPSAEQYQKAQEQQAAQEKQRGDILEKILSPEALERISRIGMVKEEKVRARARMGGEPTTHVLRPRGVPARRRSRVARDACAVCCAHR